MKESMQDRRRTIRAVEAHLPDTSLEQHHRPEYYAKLWAVDASTVLRWFLGGTGVIRTGKCVSIPESAAKKLYLKSRDEPGCVGNARAGLIRPSRKPTKMFEEAA